MSNIKKCSKFSKGFKIVPSKRFKGMYAITKNGKVYDEPHWSERTARNQMRRFGKCK